MSPDSRSTISLAKTLCFLAEGFEYETLEQTNGNATVIKFDFDNPHYTAGDVLVIMDGEEIVFHGMIGQIAEGLRRSIRPPLVLASGNRTMIDGLGTNP